MIARSYVKLVPALIALVLMSAACSAATYEERSGASQQQPARPGIAPKQPSTQGLSSGGGGDAGANYDSAQKPAPSSFPGPQGSSGPSAPLGEPIRSPVPSASQAPSPDLGKIASLPREKALTVPAQQRIVVRTVDMTLIVASVPAVADRIGALAAETGGWVVSSRRTERHRGSISVRVPADRLDEVLRELQKLAVEVKAENSTGQDVTDEYVDLQARIRNYQKTADQILKVMERPGEIKDILEVQRELTRVQEEIERLQGRLRFLEETAAFSLINVNLELASAQITVDVGADQVVAERESASFRATFTPPEGITEFSFQWDFGDGTTVATGYRTTPTVDSKSRTTATMTHAYVDLRDSPFIVTFTITGTGEAGIAKGTDTMVVTVTKVPNIQVSAGQDITTKARRPTKLTGTFTRPEGVSDLTYRWDFGDGKAPTEGPISNDDIAVTAEHAYDLASGQSYAATLTVRGKTGFGALVEGSDTVGVRVVQESPWVARVGDMGETTRAAVRALSATGQGLLLIGIWLAVFSPVWGIGVAAVIGKRRLNRRESGPAPREPGPPGGI